MSDSKVLGENISAGANKYKNTDFVHFSTCRLILVYAELCVQTDPSTEIIGMEALFMLSSFYAYFPAVYEMVSLALQNKILIISKKRTINHSIIFIFLKMLT